MKAPLAILLAILGVAAAIACIPFLGASNVTLNFLIVALLIALPDDR